MRSGVAPAGSARALGRFLTCSTACLLCLAPRASADGAVSGTIGATTDYVLRGVSQTYGGAALQLGGSYQNSTGWFAGLWGSNVNPYPGGKPSRELDLYAGYGWALNPDFTARIAYTRYTYLRDPRPTRYDYSEFAATVTYVDRLALTVSYQPDVSSYSRLGYAHDQPSYSVELSGRYPLPRRFALNAGVGYYDLDRLFGIRYWAGSAGIAFGDRRFEISLARYAADAALARLYADASANGEVVLSGLVRF